jgi:tRNA 2-thiouridine synthesizing protein A
VKIVDARGHRCPVPTLKLRKALEALPLGGEVKLIADDPMARIDVPHFAAANGLELISTENQAGAVAFTVRKA